LRMGAMGDVTIWRIVRGLEPDACTIRLEKRRNQSGSSRQSTKRVTFHGWRRRFTDEYSGVINGAYQPGELMQGLCSPWQHDFRDCACFYWAANHPDIVLGPVDPGEAKSPTPVPEDPIVPLDWLRRDRAHTREAEAFETIEKNRLHQLDHFEINK